MNHTPGPWTIRDNSIWSEDGELVEITGEYCDPERNEANARLIAAAPDLLKGLQWIERVAHDKKQWAIRQLAREHINLATKK
jgi:hypothetical protein